MKRIATASFVLLVALQVHGKEAKDSKDDLCKSLSKTAADIMSARQYGVPMSKMIEIFKKEEAALFRSLTVEAYESPRYSTESMKEKAVQDFENKAFLECYKAFKRRDEANRDR